MRNIGAFAAVLISWLLLAAVSVGQPPSGGPPGGGRGGGGFGRDPDQMFDRFANGKEVLRRSDLTDPRTQQMFDRMAEAAGITNGEMTREQFRSAMEKMRQEWGGGRGGRSGGQGNGGGPGGGNGQPNWTQWAEQRFSQLDQNGDGYLNSDEMPEDLKSELDKWDTDRNGLIDLNEFKAYFQARMQQRMAERGAGGSPGGDPIYIETPEQQERQRPVVYHAGNLPKELPAWFAALDTDKDGQIGLYEWKASGRSLEEFRRIDRNDDGFLTVEEVLYYVAQQKKNGGGRDMAAGGRPGAGGGFRAPRGPR